MTISLQVKNKHSIQESLESFVEGKCLRATTLTTVKSARRR